MLHITCNMCTRDLPDMYALGLRAYISGKSLVPMLQLLHVAQHAYVYFVMENLLSTPKLDSCKHVYASILDSV